MKWPAFFDRLEMLERETGRLYRRMAVLIRQADPGAAALLERLAEEETLHEHQVTLIRDLVESGAETGADPVLNPEFAAEMDAKLGYIREKESLFAAGLPDIPPARMMVMALDIEVQLQESHALKTVDSPDPRITRLLESLVSADRAHQNLLREWLDSSFS